MEIRAYREADLAGVKALWQEVFGPHEAGQLAETVIERVLPWHPDLLLVAVGDGSILGTVKGGYDGTRGWVYSVAVQPSQRRKGIASALLRDLEARLRAKGCPKANLQIRGDNREVVAFYESLGYVIEDRISMGRRLDDEDVRTEPKERRIRGRRSRVLSSVAEAIGETPLVELSRIGRGLEGRLLAKLEYLNPGHSKKDRIARQMIEDAEADGTLQPEQPVIELTSGNTGTGLAIVCAVTGHPFIAVMSRGNSSERARMMRALGAEVVLVDQAPGSVPGQVSGEDLDRVRQATEKLVRERGAFRADQFELESNRRAHRLHTGPEIWEQSGGEVNAFCDFVGSGGSLAGVAAALKERSPSVRCYAVEPAGAAVLAGQEPTRPGHRIQGGGYSMAELPLLDPRLVDGFLQVTDDEAIDCARRLAREEGIFAGFSAGANLAAAIQLLNGRHKGGTIAILICDSGLKYLSTDLWEQNHET